MRAIFLSLVLANLVFFGWANFIDVPPAPLPNDTLGGLPRLKLLSEVRPQPTAPAPSATTKSAGPAAKASSPGVDPAAGAHASRAPDPTPQRVASADRCVSVGPFDGPDIASRASTLLRQRGFRPRSRRQARNAKPGYWVFVGGLKSPTDAERVLRRLKQHDIADAKIMPSPNKRAATVSVGLFDRRSDAQRRARAVHQLGLDARVASQPGQGGTEWLDVNVDPRGPGLPMDELLALEDSGPRITIAACPSSPGDAPPRRSHGGI